MLAINTDYVSNRIGHKHPISSALPISVSVVLILCPDEYIISTSMIFTSATQNCNGGKPGFAGSPKPFFAFEITPGYPVFGKNWVANSKPMLSFDIVCKGVRTLRHRCRSVRRTFRHRCRSVSDILAPITEVVMLVNGGST